VVRREVSKGRDVFAGVFEHLGDEGKLTSHGGGDFLHLALDVNDVGLSEGRQPSLVDALTPFTSVPVYDCTWFDEALELTTLE